MLIRKFLFPLIKKQKLLFLTMALMSSLTLGMFVGIDYAYQNYRVSLDRYFDGCHYPSAFITTGLTKRESFDVLEDIEGVRDYDVRFSSLFDIHIKGESLKVVLSTWREDDFTRFAYLSEEAEDDYVGVYVDEQFAEAHDIEQGDLLTLGKEGHFCLAVVSRIVMKPENFCVYALGDVKTDNISYGAVFMNYDDFGTFLEDAGIPTFGLDSNQALLDIEESYDKEEVLNACKEALSEKVSVTSALIDDDTPPVRLSKEFNSQFEVVSQALPLANLVIMSLIFVLFLVQIIHKQAREIGIFLGLGYQKTSVYFLFAAFTFLISLTSIVGGILLSLPMGLITYEVYKSGVALPEWSEEIFYSKALTSSLIIIGAGQVACLISSLTFIKSSPMDALDKNYQKYINIGPKLERIVYRIPTALRLALNAIVQNGRNFFVIVLGLIASFVLIFSSLSIHSSMQEYMDYSYDVQNHYDVQVISLRDGGEEVFDELKENENVERMLVYDRAPADISYNGKTKSTIVIDFPAGNDMMQFKDAFTDEFLEVPEKGILLDEMTAAALGAEPGDLVELGGREFEVAAVIAIYTEQFQVISMESMELLDIEKYKRALVDVGNLKQFAKFCASSENDLCPVFTSNLKQMEVNYKAPFNIIISCIIAVSILLGFVVVCTISTMTLDKQRRTISILLSQGLSLSGVSTYWTIQMVIQLAVAFFIGLPLAGLAGRTSVGLLCTETTYFPFVDDFGNYLLAFAFIVAFSIVTHFVIVYLISRFNISQNVQSRE